MRLLIEPVIGHVKKIDALVHGAHNIYVGVEWERVKCGQVALGG